MTMCKHTIYSAVACRQKTDKTDSYRYVEQCNHKTKKTKVSSNAFRASQLLNQAKCKAVKPAHRHS